MECFLDFLVSSRDAEFVSGGWSGCFGMRGGNYINSERCNMDDDN